jgi:CRP/FNR family transcriptional regulator, cyclic AMP receptor protein
MSVVYGSGRVPGDTPAAPPRTLGRESVNLLAEVPLFAGLSRRHLGHVAKIASSKRFAPGGAMVRVGEPADAFYVILDGRVRVETPGRGIELKSGDFFGEMALLDGEPRSATIVTLTEVFAMIIPRAKFLKLLESEPKIALSIMATLTRRLRDAQAVARL